MIKAKNLSKCYHSANQPLWVFRDLEFSIAANQTVALMGQSGCGKSTLLHLLGGFDQASSGQITIGEQRVDTMSDSQLSTFRRQSLGMVFQQYNLVDCLSAKDNITFVRRLNGQGAMDEHTEQLIELLQLSARLDHFPAQLSGGEQQRVAIARALASKPQVILADEPTGSLDENTAAEVMALLVAAVKHTNATMLLVTHSPSTAAYLDQTWRLEKGVLHC